MKLRYAIYCYDHQRFFLHQWTFFLHHFWRKWKCETTIKQVVK